MDTACLDQLLSFEIGAMDTGQRLYNNAPSQGQSQRTTIVSRGAIVEVLRRAQKHLGTSSSIPRISPLTNITLNNSAGDDDPSSSRSGIVFTLSPAPYGWLGTSLRTKIASRDSEIALGVLQGKLACWKETIANMLETKTYPIEPLQYILFSQLTALIGVIHHWLDGAQASIRAWERAPETKESGRPDYFVQAMEDFLRSWVNLPVWEVKRTDVWGVRLSIRFAYWLMYYDIEMYLDQTTDLVCVDWQHERRFDAPDEGEPLLGDMERKLVETMLEQVILQLDSRRTSLDVLSSWDTYTLFHRASKNIVQVCPPILRDPSSLGQTSASIPAGCMQSGWGPLNLLLALLIHAGDETYGYTRPVIRPSVAHVVDRASAPASGASSAASRAGTGEDNGSGTGTGALDVEMEAGGSPGEKEEETSQGHERSGGEALSMTEGDSGYERDQRNPGLEEINEGRGERASAKENDEETEDQNDLSSDSTELFTPPAYTKPSTSALNLAFKEDASYRHVLRNGHLRDWTRCQWIPIGTGNEDGRSTDSGFKSGCASVDVISNFIPEHTQAHEEAADLARDLPAGNAPLCTAVNAGRCDASAVASPDADGDGIDPSTDLSHSARTVIVTPSLLLGDYLGHGRLYTTYRGQISFDGDTTQKPCVVKLVDFDSFSVSHSVGSTEYGSEEARQAVRNELDILAGPLRNYQGVWVPEVYGAWEVRPGDKVGEWTVKTEGACVVVMEDAGQSIWDGRGELTESERAGVIELYESIHSAGVIHGDVSWRHILLSPSSHRARPKIRMIDFDCALDLGGVRDETKLAAWVEDEMDMVRAMLDLPGAWD